MNWASTACWSCERSTRSLRKRCSFERATSPRIPARCFCASPSTEGRMRIDYSIASRAWSVSLPKGMVIHSGSVARECSGIGFTAKGTEAWGDRLLHVECVGVPPYPGASTQGHWSLNSEGNAKGARLGISYVRGDALQPRGLTRKVIVHLVNDKTPNWGGGFAMALKCKWPSTQVAFRAWASEDRALRLGNVHFFQPEEDVAVATIVAQRGYGPSPSPRIRYFGPSRGPYESRELRKVRENKRPHASNWMWRGRWLLGGCSRTCSLNPYGS